MQVSKDIFEDFVRIAIASLPERFIANMGNVSVIVADRPSPDLMRHFMGFMMVCHLLNVAGMCLLYLM